jgi:hypothetical protein
MKSSFAGLALLLSLTAPAVAATRLSVAEIQAYLNAHGGRATLERYFDLEKGEGYKLVETGRADAVALAAHLLGSSDAGVTEGLQSALGGAMAVHPEVVLPYLHRGRLLTPGWICLPFMDAEAPRPQSLAILARSRRALEQVRTAALQPQMRECLAEIDKQERNVRARP